MRNTYIFQQSLRGVPHQADKTKPPRRVVAQHESGARGRLGNAGPGRSWTLVEVIPPPKAEIPLRYQTTALMTVMMDGDHEAVIGFAEVRKDGTVDITLKSKIRLKAEDLPENFQEFTHASISINYQGLCAHNREV